MKLEFKEKEVLKFVECPLCAAPMIMRVARQGTWSGNQFLGCSTYPNCKGTRNFQAVQEAMENDRSTRFWINKDNTTGVGYRSQKVQTYKAPEDGVDEYAEIFGREKSSTTIATSTNGKKISVRTFPIFDNSGFDLGVEVPDTRDEISRKQYPVAQVRRRSGDLNDITRLPFYAGDTVVEITPSGRKRDTRYTATVTNCWYSKRDKRWYGDFSFEQRGRTEKRVVEDFMLNKEQVTRSDYKIGQPFENTKGDIFIILGFCVNGNLLCECTKETNRIQEFPMSEMELMKLFDPAYPTEISLLKKYTPIRLKKPLSFDEDGNKPILYPEGSHGYVLEYMRKTSKIMFVRRGGTKVMVREIGHDDYSLIDKNGIQEEISKRVILVQEALLRIEKEEAELIPKEKLPDVNWGEEFEFNI